MKQKIQELIKKVKDTAKATVLVGAIVCTPIIPIECGRKTFNYILPKTSEGIRQDILHRPPIRVIDYDVYKGHASDWLYETSPKTNQDLENR